MHFAVPPGRLLETQPAVAMLRGARRIIALFLLAITTAVCFQGLLHLPAIIGVLTGLSYLQFFGFYLKMTHKKYDLDLADEGTLTLPFVADSKRPFDVFLRVARTEWDNLLFLCGVILLSSGKHSYYVRGSGNEPRNVHGTMAAGHSDAGVGGSLLSIGSAAGIALMGQANSQ